MATASDDRGRRNETGSGQSLKQMFGTMQVKATFKSNDVLAACLPLNDPSFVRELQSKTNVQLTNEVGYDANGAPRPVCYSLEGTLDDIIKTRGWVEQWSKSKDERGAKVMTETSGNGSHESIHDNGRRGIHDNGRRDRDGKERYTQEDYPSSRLTSSGNEPLPHDELHDNGRISRDGRERRRQDDDGRLRLATSGAEGLDPGSRDTASNLESQERLHGGESQRKTRHGSSSTRRGRESDGVSHHSGPMRDDQHPHGSSSARPDRESDGGLTNEGQEATPSGRSHHSGLTRDDEHPSPSSRSSHSGLTKDDQQSIPSRRSHQRQRDQKDRSRLDVEGQRHVMGNDMETENTSSNVGREDRHGSPAVPDHFLSPSFGGTSSDRQTSGDSLKYPLPESSHRDQSNHQRSQNSVGDQRGYFDDQDSPASHLRDGAPHHSDASPQDNAVLDDPDISPEGAVCGTLQESQENINFVPVDAGVFYYIKKVHPSEITRIEKQFSVQITSQDMDVNESSMLRITPLGTASEETIRGANEAVVDLYSSVFAQLHHRIVDLKESSIKKEALQRAIGDVEKLYKEVMVKVSGKKVLIYGMKELDVKVAKAMVTNRLYDTARSSPSHHQDDERLPEDHHDVAGSSPTHHPTDEDHLSERLAHLAVGEDGGRRSSPSRHRSDVEGLPEDRLSERPPHLGLGVDGGQHLEEDGDVGTGRNDLHDGGDGDDEDSSPRPQDDARAEQRPPAPLKYRLRQDRLTFKTLEGLKVRVYESDITKEKVGAIVNAANEGLIHAGGVAGAIEKAAGPVMTAECQIHITKHGMLYPSQVIWTGAGNLPCHYIIHAVGPRWGEYKNKDECYETLKTTFVKCLEAADRKLQVAGMSMPLISSGIFGMPIAHCIDALYEAVTQFSRSWHRDVNILKEVNVVEIDEETVKTVQDHLVGKITGEVRETVVKHKEPEDTTAERRRKTRSSDGRSQHRNEEPLHLNHSNGNDRAVSVGLLDRRNERERDSSTGLPDRRHEAEVDDIFAANENRFTHEGSPLAGSGTRLTGSDTRLTGLDTKLTGVDTRSTGLDTRLTGSSASEAGRADLNRFGMHKFSSLPNLGSNHDDGSTQDLPGNYGYGRGSSSGSRTSPISTQNNFIGTHGYGSDSSRTLSKYGRLQNDTRGYDLHSTSGRPPPYQSTTDDLHTSPKYPPTYQNSTDDPTVLGAAGGVSIANNESLIQTILNQHESEHQTPEQVEETQKLLDNLLGTTDDHGTKDRSRRSRRTQSLDRASRKSKGKDRDLGGGYDLHTDPRVKRDDGEEYKKCSVCFSRRDLTSRKDCCHKLCKSCHRIGLFKGGCSFCKSKTKTPRGSDERGRSKTKKAPLPDSKTLNPLHGHKDFHVVHGSPSNTQKKGPMIARTATSTSPDLATDSTHHNLRLDPVGHAPDRGSDYYSTHLSTGRTHSDSRKDTRTEAWVANSNQRSSSKTYDYSNYTMTGDLGTRSDASRPPSSPRQRRRQEKELAATHLSEGQHQPHPTTRDKSDGMGSRGQASGGRGDAGSSSTCPICMDVMTNPKILSECKHTFCKACIDKAMKLKAMCPVCGVVYGQLFGNQPAGTMTNYVEPTDLPGYEGCGTIVISYRFPDGVQGEDHPNPSQSFRGTARMAYLPNNIEGQEVFRLLERAFKARLLFTIGQSVTTGEQNTVIWNDIHHKTRRTGGAENHGYPDPGYLKRVREEVSSKGIK